MRNGINDSVMFEGVLVEEEYLHFLDGLRDSGITNMYGAAPYIEDAFGVTKQEARKILLYWMSTFSERQKEN